jgi:S1-C subfamily serine protease
MNLIDVLIIILIIGALFRGLELGFVRQLFSTGGFFAGLILGTILEPHVIGYAHTPTSRILVTFASTLGIGLLLLLVGEIAGALLKQRLQFQDGLNHVDNSLGAMLAGLSLLLIVWLSASVLILLPYASMQSSIRGSKIVSLLDHNLPPAPTIIADLGRLIAPNGFPNVFIGAEPQPTEATLPTPADLAAAVNKDRQSVVKVQGQGCGGIVTGSGFVVGNGLVATNAHVVAGINAPMVIDENGSHPATAIWFDPNLDFSLLRTNDLSGQPLTFNVQTIPHGTPGGVFGYPGGGPFAADTAAVLDEFTAVGRNIYNQGSVKRDVYSIKATVVPGNSGGPLVDTNGNVIGVVFATSTTYNNVGYALSAPEVQAEVNQAEASNQPVSTGTCAE